MSRYDIAIIGAGIAGASLAAEIGDQRKVVLIEAEDQPGYHSTGRSAAFWSETYGGSDIQPLTTASHDFLARPPAEFADSGFLRPRGALHLGCVADEARAAAMEAEFAQSGVRLDRVTAAAIDGYLPGRKPDWRIALWEPDCSDIDVAGLHQAYLRAARRAGAHLVLRAAVSGLEWSGGAWRVITPAGDFEASVIANAAGAWADRIGVLAGIAPIGIQPHRRTMVQIEVAPKAPPQLPLIVGLDGTFYFKPEGGGRIWLSPHDEIPSEPCDAAPDEIDIAMAIAKFEQVVDWQVRRVEHSWAGLRSFAPDRLPVIGHDPRHDGFFWLAGQGGFGIQTAPAVARLAAAQLTGRTVETGPLVPQRYSPTRFL